MTLSRLGYFALAGPIARRHPHDLLVEDFGAPFSVAGSPLFDRGPVVASVQWLFAHQMRAKYHLPVDWVERAGLPLYRDFIAVSEWLAGDIRRRRPGTVVEVIPNGVEEAAFAAEPAPPEQLAFLGRLDNEQKGCDLLLDIYAEIRRRLSSSSPPLHVVGDGPDERWLRQRVASLGLGSSVVFRGRIDGEEKYRILASSHALLMPSRHETFGMVAVEAQAAGAPVVAFDVGPLREVAGGGGAVLVPPFDVHAFAAEAVGLVGDPVAADRRRRLGREWARRYDWGEIARRQEDHYLRALQARRRCEGVRA